MRDVFLQGEAILKEEKTNNKTSQKRKAIRTGTNSSGSFSNNNINGNRDLFFFFLFFSISVLPAEREKPAAQRNPGEVAG